MQALEDLWLTEVIGDSEGHGDLPGIIEFL